MLIHTHFAQLLPLFSREREAQRPMVLATIISTAGSTYRKPGAQMLIAQSGEYAGLLSGGCLEGDLREHAGQAIATGLARIIEYDMRSADDQLFGLGAGCEGTMQILLQPVDAAHHWQPLAELQQRWLANQSTRLAIITGMPDNRDAPLGLTLSTDGLIINAGHHPQALDSDTRRQLALLMHTAPGNQLVPCAGRQIFMLECSPPPRLLILGAGPDAQPLATLAQFLGWKSTIYDHRPAYAQASRFVHAEHVLCARPELLHTQLAINDFHAVIVMSHHLNSDLLYLQQLAHSTVPYVGLLGPAARRERLFTDLGAAIDKLRPRLHAPVGLNIGATTPEAIALSIISEIHHSLAQLQC